MKHKANTQKNVTSNINVKTAKKNKMFIKGRYLIILGAIIIAAMFFLRTNSGGLLFGNQAYYHLMVAEKIHNNPNLIIENLYLREYSITPFHIILAMNPTPIFAQFLSTISAIACAVLFYFLLKRLNYDDPSYSIALLLSSTMFIYFAVFVNSDSLALLISFAAILLYLKMQRKYIAAATAISFLLIFFPPFNLALLLILFLIYADKKKDKSAFYSLSTFLIFSLIINSQFYFQFEQQKLLSDFGSFGGLSVIVLLFGLAGIFLNWKETKWITLVFIAIFILSLKYSNMNIYTNFFLISTGGIALSFLTRYKWADKNIMNLMFLVIFSSILFSTLSYVTFSKDANPKKDTYDALSFLSSTIKQNELKDNILSEDDKSILITYFGLTPFIPISGNANKNIAEEVFLSNSLEKTRKLLEINDIRYIVLDAKMHPSDEGIEYVLGNKENFEMIYDKNSVQIWRYVNLS